MKTSNLNVFVVDDDEPVRRAVVTLLALDGNHIQAFASGEQFLERAQLQHGGCVILDLRMDGMNGLEVFDELRRRDSPLVVIFMSGHGTLPDAWKAAQNGAFEWLQKPCSDDVLKKKVREALDRAADVADRHLARQRARALWQTLTPREQQVARLVAAGLQSKQIADELGNEHRTVDTHRAKVYAKLDLDTPVELERFLRENGI
jgi:two-component system, LuxR family, response regulator TtrR